MHAYLLIKYSYTFFLFFYFHGCWFNMTHFVSFEQGILVILAHDVGLQITLFLVGEGEGGMGFLAMQRAR